MASPGRGLTRKKSGEIMESKKLRPEVSHECTDEEERSQDKIILQVTTSDNEEKNVKTTNLKDCDLMYKNLREKLPIELVGLSDPEMNGKEGTLINFDSKKGKWNVEVEGRKFRIKPQNVQPGDTASIKSWIRKEIVEGLVDNPSFTNLVDKLPSGLVYKDRVILPFFSGNGSKQKRWDIILQSLGTKNKMTWRNMASQIEELNPKLEWNLKGLKDFNEDTSLKSSTPETFEKLQQVLEEATKIMKNYKHEPIMFSNASYISQTDQKTFTNKEILTFLTLSLFCSYPGRNVTKFGLPSANFHQLYTNLERSFSAQAKMNCLWAYFTAATQEPDERKITFMRRSFGSFPKWKKSFSSICDVEFTTNKIEDFQGKALEVDFANKYIGGGVLGSGAVQEEIRMVLSPEMIAARLFTPKLEQNETLFIKGAKRYSTYSGYASGFKFRGPFHDNTPIDDTTKHMKSEIVAMDAVHYHNTYNQFSQQEIDREINKAYAAFKPIDDDPSPFSSVATGYWGCGVFNGDKELKAIIQLLAASEAERNLIFCMTENKFSQDFDLLLQKIKAHNIKVRTLYRIIVDFDVFEGISVFEKISELIDTYQTGYKIEEHIDQSKASQQNLDNSQVSSTNTAVEEQHMTETQNTPEIPTVYRREKCRYGDSCYRKNPTHFEEFAHPGDQDWNGE